MFATPIRKKINSDIRPIIEQSIWRRRWRTEEQIAQATGVSVDKLRRIRSNPCSVPSCELFRFLNRLDSRAAYDIEMAWVDISIFSVNYRRRWGWALRMERASRDLVFSHCFWIVLAVRIAYDLFRYLKK